MWVADSTRIFQLLHLVMEACAENGVPLIVLDRPNPMEITLQGQFAKTVLSLLLVWIQYQLYMDVPVGELAQMINGEGWLENQAKCELIVVPVKNYDHKMRYSLPVRPSPNLPNEFSCSLVSIIVFF